MEWINLKDDQPDEMQSVIAYQPNKQDHFTQLILCYHKGEFYEYDGSRTKTLELGTFADITHWMPRPLPPTQNESMKELFNCFNPNI